MPRSTLDCLRQLESDPRVLHVPLGKLHTEPLVPADLQLRVSLPALMQLFGHKDIRMTSRYVEVTQ